MERRTSPTANCDARLVFLSNLISQRVHSMNRLFVWLTVAAGLIVNTSSATTGLSFRYSLANVTQTKIGRKS